MNLRFKSLFPDEWPHILNIYKSFLSPEVAQSVSQDLLLSLIEVGIKFGERLFQLQSNGFVEIGCGLALPSLTLAKLGQNKGLAIDLDAKVLLHAKEINDRLGCNLEFQCSDIFNHKPKLQKGGLLIAEKPTSYKKNTLEVEYKIKNWCTIEEHNFAIIPSYLATDTMITYSARCEKYKKSLNR